MAIKLVKTWKYKAGYHIRYEELSGDDAGGGSPFVMRTAFTPDGDYIGSPRWARGLSRLGIVPELADSDDNVCSVGFNETEQKWCGWSHRAMCSFGIGDKLFEERWDKATDDTPFIEHGEVDIVDLNQARLAACRFADYVG